jgi:signal transduction histidine kinase/DNA-binding NarL/FixJ family response regulator
MSNLPNPDESAPSPRMTIFLVDDEPIVLRPLKRCLESLGHRVRTFNTPQDALKIALASAPECIISDYYMPVQNGVEFLEQVRDAHPQIARVILTGGTVDDRLKGAIEDGTVQILARKPWSKSTMKSLMDKLRAGELDGFSSQETSQDTGGAATSEGQLVQKAKQVLVVDDDNFFLEVTCSLLAKLGCLTVGLESTKGIDELLSEGKIDLVLMDLMLNGESGFDAIEKISSEFPTLPIIAITGRLERSLAMRALRCGASGVLHKPLDSLKIEVALKHSDNLRSLDGNGLRRPELGALFSLQHAISSGIEIQDLLDVLAQQVIRFTRADRACVFLSDPGLDSLDTSASYGCSPNELHEKVPFSESLCQRVYEQGRPQSIVEYTSSETPQAILALPMHGRDAIVGVVLIAKEGALETFERDVIDTALLLAGEVGKAVERKWLEDQRHELERSVMRRDKLATIGELASGVAHELNNPLGYVSSNVHSLKEYFAELQPMLACLSTSNGGPDPDRATALAKEQGLEDILEDLPECIQETLEGIDRVLKIVHDLRTFARDDAESKEASDINQVLESAIQILRSQLKHKAELVRDFSDLPAIECFPSQLGQVFLNLLFNAVQAIERTGQIGLRTWVEDESVMVELRDDGCGMPAKVLARIFEPFYTTKPPEKGTGLGLSIVRKIVERHGGRISASSKPGIGTTFLVSLPVHPPADGGAS